MIFNFFLNSYRKNILTFSGSEDFKVEFDKNGPDSKFCFRMFEDGNYKNKTIKTTHPNIVYGVIKGKKSWGLWVKEWSQGINDWSFTKKEIMEEFEKNKIQVPEPFVKDFENVIEKLRQERIEKEIERLNSGGMWK